MICLTEDIDDIKRFSFSPLVSKASVPFYFKNSEQDGVFVQKDDNGKVTALLSLFDGDCTVLPEENADYKEIISFLNYKGFSSLTTSDKRIFDYTENIRVSDYNLLKFFGINIKNKTEDVLFLNNADKTEVYKMLFDLVLPNGSCFPVWFCDVAKRLNSGFLDCVYIKKNGVVVSCAFSPSSFSGNALVSGVATKEEYRNRGLASVCVGELTKNLLLKNKNIYLWCESDLINFYNKSGFNKISCIYVGRK